jgi:RHS repeat-associated protein
MPPRALRTRALVGIVVASLVLQAGAVAPERVQAAPGPVLSSWLSRTDPARELDAVRPRPEEVSVAPAWTPVVFDNFNRTVADGWGGGWGKWSFCGTGDLSVDGQAGHVKTTASGECIAFRDFGPWTQPSWTMTARFKTPTDLAGPALSFDLITAGIGNIPGFPYDMYVAMGFGTSNVVIGAAGGITDFATFEWQPNTWYVVKWLHAWGNQSRAKVWLATNSEPAEWLVARNATQDTRQQPENRALQIALVESVSGSMESQVDDIVFSEAPVLPVVPIPPATDHNPPYGNEETAGDPVNTFSGTFSDAHTDTTIAGRGPAIQFARSYNSNDTRATVMGPGWTHSYDTRLVSPSQDTEDIVLVGPMGRSDTYVYANGAFTPPLGVHRTLVRNADESYTATDKDQTAWVFSMTGRLTQIRDRYGNVSNLTYNANNQLFTISDPAGRGVLTLAYTSGKLTSIADWASPARVVGYQYDTNGRLWKVTDREGKTTTYTYDGTSQRLATITNARGNVVTTNTYDAQGRVSTQKDARGVVTGDATTYDYVVNPDGTRLTTVTAPATSFEPSFHPTLADSYDANGWLTGRATRPTSTEQLTQTFTYDEAGNRASITDARGNRTDYCYDVTYAGTPISGGDGDLTRVIDPPPTTGANRPVALFAFDAKNNVVQTVSPKGVPSNPSVTCSSDLSAIDTRFAINSTYDAAGAKLLSKSSSYTDPDLGLKTSVTKYEYSDAANPGRVTRTIPPRGNTTPTPDYTYATTMTYNTSGAQAGTLKDVTDPLGNKTSYSYDPVGRLTSTVDPLGNVAGGVPAEHTTTTTYDNEDRVRLVKRPAPTAGGAQLVTENRYDEVGNPVVRIDAAGQVTKYVYDERNSLFQVKDSPATWTDPAAPPPQVITTEYTRDAGGNPTRIARAKGDAQNERVLDYVYDGRGLPRTETQYPAWPATTGPLVTSYTYDAAGNQATVTDPIGDVLTIAYDTLNRRLSLDYSDPNTPDVVNVYDANGNRTQMTDGTGSTTYVLDEANRFVSVTSPGPKTVGYRYDLDGNRTKLIYPDTTAVTYVFNKAGQLSSLADWAARTASYTYWPDGLVKTATNPDASIATYTYDNARRVTDVLHQRNTTTISHQGYQLDKVGNVAALVDSAPGPTQPPVWSPAVATDTVGAGEAAIALGADGTGYATWADARSGTVDIWFARRDPGTGVWGASERVNEVTTAQQNQPAIVVDQSGNAYVAWADQRAGTTDSDIYFSKRSSSTGLWSPSVKVNDDGAGKRQDDPALAISATGEVIAAWYDERGGGSKFHIYSARLPAGSTTWSANMKVTSNTSSIKGQPDLSIGPTGITYAVWLDRQSGNEDIWFASLPSGSTTWSTNTKISDDPGTALQDAPKIGTDTAGNLMVVWNDARTTPSQIRSRRRPAGSSNWSASIIVGGSLSSLPSLAVRPDGRAYGTWSNGAFGSTTVWGSEYDPTTLSWSAAERLSEPTDAAYRPAVGYSSTQLIVLYERPIGNGGQIFSRRKALAGDETYYGYDRLYRLTSVVGPDGPRSYAYDPVGNRLSRVAGATTSYTYDRADRITSAGSTAITVDANGNTTAKGADTFDFDQANRLTAATVAGSAETYVYDGDGTRFSRQVGTATPIRNVVDRSGPIAVTIDDGSRKYVYGIGLAFAVSGTSLEVYHTDRLGSVRALTDASGAVSATYRTDEWGVPISSTGSSGQPLRFTGEPRDATGLTYLRTRYYDPDLGRFLTRDTWPGVPGAAQTQNRYAYTGNNPTTYADPSGLFVDTALDIAFMAYDAAALLFGPEKDRQANFLALLADAASAMIPFVTGGGLAVRASMKAADHVDDAIGAANALERAAKAACSFIPETLVATPDGLVPISAIKVSDIVFAWDEVTGQVVERTVTAVHLHSDTEIARLGIDGATLVTTPNHPFLTLEHGWIEAGLLWPGAHIKSRSGFGTVTGVVTQSRDSILWNLTVEGAHTFFVGGGEWLVHNSCPIIPGRQGKHVPGDPNFIPGRSELTHPDPQSLLDRAAGNGQPVAGVPGQAGYRERFDFQEVIGNFVENGVSTPTTVGIIHYAEDGAHIVPARP